MKISLVVPVFNEEATIPIFYKTVREFEGLQQHEVEIVFINDGSKDATESIINELAVADPLVVSLSFTRNFGKEPALFAGLDHATGEAIIPIDVDLQDPIEVIPHLIEKWQAGACNFAFFSGLIGAQFWAERAQPKSPELDAKLLVSC